MKVPIITTICNESIEVVSDASILILLNNTDILASKILKLFDKPNLRSSL